MTTQHEQYIISPGDMCEEEGMRVVESALCAFIQNNVRKP